MFVEAREACGCPDGGGCWRGRRRGRTCPSARVGTGQALSTVSTSAPPVSWTASQRHQLANSLLVEYQNTVDAWYVPGVDKHGHGDWGILTNIDSMVEATQLNYSAPGSWNDADMLQLCTYGEGATRHWNSTGLPDDHHGLGLTLVEYTSHLSLWDSSRLSCGAGFGI